jgi:transcriptional regulator with GAF, ATPase, and Fis domain
MTVDDREGWIARTLVELADTLVADFDVIDLASVLVERCVELLDVGDAAVVLWQGEMLREVASSSPRSGALEMIEAQYNEGPCHDCVVSGEPILRQRLEHCEQRWPHFAPKARGAGFQMVYALPLRRRGEVVGALSIFCDESRELSVREIEITQALAEAATVGILQERAVAHGTTVAEQLQQALDSRIVIEQAKGIVTEARHVGMDQAFAMLVSYARNSRIRLSTVASAVINRTLPASGLPLVPPARR